ncbi:MAG TPA: hypothetical protein DCL77_14360 [Prolixibacteraceae bacterium]|jgi:hypothetical protein|nr:hypothetical protein [Prolixibacteraceae bacterium]
MATKRVVPGKEVAGKKAEVKKRVRKPAVKKEPVVIIPEEEVSGEQGAVILEEKGTKELKELNGTEQGIEGAETVTEGTEQGVEASEVGSTETVTEGTEQGAEEVLEEEAEAGTEEVSRLPVVSVLMVVTDPDMDLLNETLKSLMEQDCEAPFEGIMIDNGSTGENATRLLKFCHESGIVLLIGASIGLAQALNVGLSTCRGEFVANLRVGDIAEPNWINDMYEFMKREPERCIAAGCQIKFMGDQEGRISKHPAKQDKSAVMAYPAGYYWVTNFPGSFIKRQKAIDLGGFPVVEGNDLPVDFAMWCKILKAGYSIYTNPTVLMNYLSVKRTGEQSKKRAEFLLATKKGLR